jgi:RNA recognition motif-containing protein
MKIYVGNLPYTFNEEQLQQIFESFGQVQSIRIIKDPTFGISKGFGFVEMPSFTEARSAINCLTRKGLKGRSILVNEALKW